MVRRQGYRPVADRLKAQTLDHIGLGRRHMHEGVGGISSSTLDGVNGAALQALPTLKIELGPLRFRKRPVRPGTPFVRSHHPIAHRWPVHNAGVDIFQPVIVPAQDFAMQRMKRTLKVSGTGEHHFFGAVIFSK